MTADPLRIFVIAPTYQQINQWREDRRLPRDRVVPLYDDRAMARVYGCSGPTNAVVWLPRQGRTPPAFAGLVEQLNDFLPVRGFRTLPYTWTPEGTPA